VANTHKRFVTAFKMTRAYGGAEEGGWYYTIREPIESLATLCCGATGGSYGYTPDSNGAGSFRYDPHPVDCPALAVADMLYNKHVLGHTERYTADFITAGGTYDPNGPDDAPAEYSGEVATTGKHTIMIQEEFPEASPRERPHYE